MKKVILAVLLILVLIVAWWLLRGKADNATFSGVLQDGAGLPIAEAVISVGGKNTTTDREGRFVIEGRPVDQNRWVLEARLPGFAPVSKIFGGSNDNVDISTVPTSVQVFDAATVIVARDNRTNCIGSTASSVDWGAHPTARYPQVIDAGGNAVTGEIPASAVGALDFLSDTQPCNTGFQVTIPASSLVSASGTPATGQIQVELSTVDLYSADGMPGDYTVMATADGPAYMESFGAGTIELRSGDDVLQLAKGATAEIRIPVDRGQVNAGSKIPESIPLLRYEGKSGLWNSIGNARLDEDGSAYVGEVNHFSEFNADIVRTNPACMRFDASGISGSFSLVITAPTSSGGYKQVTRTVQPNASQVDPNLHALYNLPPNEWVVLRAVRSGTPLGTWILETPAAWGNTGAPAYDYAACGTAFDLSETVAPGPAIAGSGRRFGPLVKHVSFLVDTSGATEDVYPPGGANCANPCFYLFSIFDTGSTLAVIDSATTTLHGLTQTPNASWDVDVRIDGFTSLSAGSNPAAQFGLPGTANSAQANTGVLRVAPRPVAIVQDEDNVDAAGVPTGLFVPINFNLMGAPVTNKVLARIDFTNMITRGPWTFLPNDFTISAPASEFFLPGAPGIPAPSMTLFTEGFGSAAASNTGTTDQRHFLQNVTFSNGSANVFDNQGVSNPVRFVFDTGTAFTVISQAMANTLGASPANPNPAVGCSSLNTANFVQLDSITIVGMNSADQLSTYRINDAEVCVDVGGTVITTNYEDPANPTGPPRLADAVIGTNLFDQSELLWDGPRRTLGILP